MQIDREAPLRFLKTAFLPDDWIAVFLKRHDTGEAIQRVGPLDMVLTPRFQSWLRFKNAHGFSVFVSVNSLTPGRHSRTRDCVRAVRHVFLDADRDCEQLLATIERRRDLPAPSFVIWSSAGRAHALWRVTGMSVRHAEALQKHLAQELGTDEAATSTAQMTRLPGFFNHKYHPPQRVEEARAEQRAYRTREFPEIPACAVPSTPLIMGQRRASVRMPMVERARRYLAATPPAIEGQYGDAMTFRICCRLVGEFALGDVDAAHVLREWNSRCRPPWSDNQLSLKIRSARRCSLRGPG